MRVSFSCTLPRASRLRLLYSLRPVAHAQGGGPGLDEAAPSSAASPAEHLDFIRLFCSQMRQRQEEGEAEPQRDAKVSFTLTCTAVLYR